MPPSLLCHFLSVPKGGIVSKFDCIQMINVGLYFPEFVWIGFVNFVVVVEVQLAENKFKPSLSYCFLNTFQTHVIRCHPIMLYRWKLVVAHNDNHS